MQGNSLHAGSWQALQVRVQGTVDLCVDQLWAQGWDSTVPLMIVEGNPCKADRVFTPQSLHGHLHKEAFVYPCCYQVHNKLSRTIIFWLVLAGLTIFWTHSSRAVISSSSERWTDILFHSYGFQKWVYLLLNITLNARWICSVHIWFINYYRQLNGIQNYGRFMKSMHPEMIALLFHCLMLEPRTSQTPCCYCLIPCLVTNSPVFLETALYAS